MFKVVESKEELNSALNVRYQVFTIGQGIDSRLDIDGKDDDAVNLIAITDNQVVGTVRFLVNGDKSILQRLSVLPEYRNRGLAKGLIEYGFKIMKDYYVNEINAHAQVRSLDVYLKTGFKTVGEEFLEVGVPHISIRKMLV